MRELKGKINDYKTKGDLNGSYVEALKDDKFKKLLVRLKLTEKEALKYTSKLEKTTEELSNCETCKHLFECKNEVKGFVYYPRMYNGMLSFDYVACKYMKKEIKKEEENKSLVYEMPKEIREACMKDIDISDKNRVKAIKYLKDFYDKYGDKSIKGLYLYGSFGCGKSYLISAMLNELAKKGKSVIMMYYPEMLRRLKESFNDNEAFAAYMRQLKNVDLLLIDDIGAETVSSWNRDEILGTILQARMDNNLPTFFTSNFSLEELENHFVSSKGSDDVVKARRIMERIKFMTNDIEIVSENRRK